MGLLPGSEARAPFLMLHRFVNVFREAPAFDSDLEADHRCCNACRLVALLAFKIFESMPFPCVEDLQNVGAHSYRQAYSASFELVSR